MAATTALESTPPLRKAWRLRGREQRRGIPIALRLRGATVADRQRVTGRQLEDAAEERQRVGHVAEAQVGQSCARIDRPIDPRRRQQRLQLRAEHEASGRFGVVERLDPEAVARQEERTARRIPDREGEHAPQALDAALARFLVEVHDHLRVRARAEVMAAGRELRGELAVVVDLTVEDDPDRTVLVGQRLISGLEIDDTEPPHSEAQRTVEMLAASVRAPMEKGLRHTAKRHPRRGLGRITRLKAEDPAHDDDSTALAV
jgi:hypothetical protein